MNVRLLTVGKLKEKYWTGAEAEYKKRLISYCNLSIEEIKESPSEDVNWEGKEILKKVGARDYVITLEILGNKLNSEQLSNKINELGIEGKSNITFVIGGSSGLSKEVEERSDFKLSFSDMTFPHQMMRIIFLEQIYRSFKIIKREKYHK